MIICGFAGVGKTTLCKSKAKWIDLESTPFEKDWERYIKVASHMSDQGYHVMISCHEPLRKLLHEKDIPYLIILPSPHIDLKEEYLDRYRFRGSPESFIRHMDSNWNKYSELFPWEQHLYLGRDECISDVIDIIEDVKVINGKVSINISDFKIRV